MIDAPSMKDGVFNLFNSTTASLHAAIAYLNSALFFSCAATASTFSESAVLIYSTTDAKWVYAYAKSASVSANVFLDSANAFKVTVLLSFYSAITYLKLSISSSAFS